ncbi:MAG: phosphoglucomutase/phosphomannomutase family protein [Armatimonadota bacterium]|nr:MAG: phosphoglucomutase/phosphomannomutase family protein [Armatimonadota bacterium]
MAEIRFGTEGWRAVLADGYTFDNVRVVARAAARWFKQQPRQAPVAIGHDTRFLGDRFAAAAADELAHSGIEPHLCTAYLPTPAIGYYVVANNLAGALVLTASHNPAEWNGVKLKAPEGGPAEEADVKWVGDEANRILRNEPHPRAPARDHQRFDVREAYLERILSLVDRDAIARAKLTVVADIMHGAGGGYFDEALRRAGCAEVRTVRPDPDPTFDGKHPEPIGPNLEESVSLTADPDVSIGLATDGDGDRLGLMAHGEYIDIQRSIVFVLYHLLKNRGWRGRVMRSINVTSMVDRLCDHYRCSVTETSVGFKNMGPEMVKSDDVLLAVEESGGFGIKGHIPDRDGSLAALIACEALAYEAKPARDILSDIFALTGGRCYFDRLDLRLQPEQRDKLHEALPSLAPDALAGQPVETVNRLDGAKYIRKDGSWLLLRLSGTEPLVRVYVEARGEADVHKLLEAGRDLVLDMAKG